MESRLTERCNNSNRMDDVPETIWKRIDIYTDQATKVIDYYYNFGKVRTVNASVDPSLVYKNAKDAITP